MSPAEITIRVAKDHQFTRTPASMGCTKSTCSCGIDVANTNATQHIARAERSHRKAIERKINKGGR